MESFRSLDHRNIENLFMLCMISILDKNTGTFLFQLFDQIMHAFDKKT